MPLTSFSRRLVELAESDPDRPAITCGDETVTRSELLIRADDLACELVDGGVGEGAMVSIAVPNSVDWFVAVVAAWRIGAIPQPLSSRLPRPELEAIVELADSAVVVGVEPGSLGDRWCLPVGYRAAHRPGAEPLPEVVSPSWKAPTSGGSTGRPKLIVAGDPAVLNESGPPPLALQPDDCLVMPGPLYHNGPIVWSCQVLVWGGHVVVLPRFDAEGTLAAIAQHRAEVVYLVPTMMKRILALPEAVRAGYDLSSLRVVWHLAEPCPAWLKEAWVDWLGPERIYELYGGTEGQLATIITGTQWLEHRGSVGRPIGGDVMICDLDGNELPTGELGEVWLRSARDTATYRYVGAEARTREGGWESLGDNGWVDADGYLYLGDRIGDMILVGGANVYPAEVESALLEHPAVRTCAVIGLPDEDKGNRVHAIVEADPGELDEAELRTFLAERLVSYKLPRTYEVVDEPLRDEAGKVRRAALRADRT
ncbi:MAG: AMP-binding protein [Acidimicrobiia bacterium]